MVKHLAVFASGRGSNFRAIVDHAKLDVLRNVEVCLLITNDAAAPAAQFAKENGIYVEYIEGVFGRKFENKNEREKARDLFDQRAVDVLKRMEIDLVALAGFMQVLGPTMVEAYRMSIMNIHPAIDLVRFGGRGMFGERVHAAVLSSGEKESGCTIHYVDESVDGGPIILQSRVPIRPTDTPETLAHRVLTQEHRTYSKAIQLHVDNRIKIIDGKAVIDLGGGWEKDWNRRQERFIQLQTEQLTRGSAPMQTAL